MSRSDLTNILSRDYGNFHSGLKESGFSSFERGIIYTGLGIGMFAPVALTRYGILPQTDSVIADLGYWMSSIALNTMSSAMFKGFPLTYSAGVGFFVGFPFAFVSKKFRERKRRD